MILCIGCSWTYGLGVEAHQSYPAHLQNLIDEKVINAGHPGIDIQYALYSAYRLMQNYDFRLIIFQLTTLDRLSLGLQGKDNFLKGNYYDNRSKEIYFESEKYYRVKGIGDTKVYPITPANYLKAQNKKTDLDCTVRFLMENTIHDNYKQDCLSIMLNNLQQQVPTVFFPWVNWHTEFKNSLMGDKIKIPDISVKEYLEQENKTYMYLDNGFHLTDDGNRLVAEKYVRPLIKDYL